MTEPFLDLLDRAVPPREAFSHAKARRTQPRAGKTAIVDAWGACACNGVTDFDIHGVMGAGMPIRKEFAEPWRRAAVC